MSGGDRAPLTAPDWPARPAVGLAFAAPLGNPVAPGNGGELRVFHMALGGPYRVELGGKAWIDVVQRGMSLWSAAHAHHERCSGVVKMVDFTLAPGNCILRLKQHRPRRCRCCSRGSPDRWRDVSGTARQRIDHERTRPPPRR